MGYREVLGVAAVASVLAVARPASADERVVIVDLRPGADAARLASRDRLADGLDHVQGIAVPRDDGIDVALAGEAADRDAARARAALDEARAAYGALDCAKARPAADRAVDLLAARQASGLDDGAALRTAWAYVLLCADHDGDTRAAHRAADRLRGLGVRRGDEAGVSDATWQRYPELDAATDRDIVELSITVSGTTSGAVPAEVWVDHLRAGTAPLTVFVPSGAHLIAAGAGARRGAVRVDAAPGAAPVDVAVADQSGRWSEVAGRVRAWRDGAAKPTADELGALLTRVGARFAFVLAGTATAEVWALGPGETRARKVASGPADDPAALATAVTERAGAWDAHAPDPDQPLVREDPRERDRRRRGERVEEPARWWVYASILGAVLAGSAVVYAHDSANDRQRVEVNWP